MRKTTKAGYVAAAALTVSALVFTTWHAAPCLADDMTASEADLSAESKTDAAKGGNATPAGKPDSADSKASAQAESDPKRPYKEDAIKHYNKGHDLHQQGMFNDAIKEYRDALAADDRMEEAYTNLGLIYAAQRNYSKAIEVFKKSLALNPNRPNALNGLGTVLYAKNRFNEAIEKWQEAVKMDPHFASAFYNMANAYENEKDYQNAVENYVNALVVAPNMPDAYYRIGAIYAKQKHPAQAGVLLTKAVQLQPNGDFVRDAKKMLDSINSELDREGTDEPDVKMNVVAPPSPASEAASKSGGI